MKRVLLVGAGHAHALVLDGLRRRPMDGASVVVVSPGREQVYSGMVPGYLAGHYARDQITIDAAALAARSGTQFVLGSVVMLDPGRRVARLHDGRELPYDVASLNIGSLTDTSTPGASHALPVKPLERFLLELRLGRGTKTGIVGGGVAGAELAMALAFRGLEVTLHAERPFAGRLGAALRKNAVRVVSGGPAEAIEAGHVVVTRGGRAAYDQVILATGAAAPHWLLSAGLELDGRGFALVERTLLCASRADLFAVGDCATLREGAHAKSGVYSVRHARVLELNLRATVKGEPLRRYKPQRRALLLISCGERRAIAQWGGVESEGRWLWRLKDAIDRGWIAQFQ